MSQCSLCPPLPPVFTSLTTNTIQITFLSSQIEETFIQLRALSQSHLSQTAIKFSSFSGGKVF